MRALITREKWDPYGFVLAWVDIVGVHDLVMAYCGIAKSQPGLKMCLLTLRGIVCAMSTAKSK